MGNKHSKGKKRDLGLVHFDNRLTVEHLTKRRFYNYKPFRTAAQKKAAKAQCRIVGGHYVCDTVPVNYHMRRF